MSRELVKNRQNIMEEVQDIVIVGAGIAGLTTSLGLHRHNTGELLPFFRPRIVEDWIGQGRLPSRQS